MRIEGFVETIAANELAVTYDMTGDINSVRWPEISKHQFRQGLWKTTCFELFIGAHSTERYLEFNFSPSTEWCGLSFKSYRHGQSDIRELAFSKFDVTRSENAFSMHVQFVAPEPLLDAGKSDYRAALTAVVEETDGRLVYWADAHRSEAPDFHNNKSFERDLTLRKETR
ncbi:MAG: DOMON-like domain-containing protein [Henriciella sp.]